MGLNPDIQKYFDFKYVEGELHIFIRKELVSDLGWTDKDIELSFGNIKKMNSFKGASLTVSKIDQTYEHPWHTEINKKTDNKPSQGGRQRDMDAL